MTSQEQYEQIKRQLLAIMSQLTSSRRSSVINKDDSYERGFEEGYNALAEIIQTTLENAHACFSDDMAKVDEEYAGYILSNARTEAFGEILRGLDRIGPGT